MATKNTFIKPKQLSPAYTPAGWEPADASALQALLAGDANSVQQKRALDWIINKACATYDQSFRPGGEDGRRETDFALGRAFAGQQIVGMLKINLSVILKDERPQPKEKENERPA